MLVQWRWILSHFLQFGKIRAFSKYVGFKKIHTLVSPIYQKYLTFNVTSPQPCITTVFFLYYYLKVFLVWKGLLNSSKMPLHLKFKQRQNLRLIL